MISRRAIALLEWTLRFRCLYLGGDFQAMFAGLPFLVIAFQFVTYLARVEFGWTRLNDRIFEVSQGLLGAFEYPFHSLFLADVGGGQSMKNSRICSIVQTLSRQRDDSETQAGNPQREQGICVIRRLAHAF